MAMDGHGPTISWTACLFI